MEEQEKNTIEQNLHAIHVQEHGLEQQLMESELALKELSSSKNAYKIVGTLMIETDAATLRQEIERKQEAAKNRLQMLKSQEQKLREKLGHGNNH